MRFCILCHNTWLFTTILPCQLLTQHRPTRSSRQILIRIIIIEIQLKITLLHLFMMRLVLSHLYGLLIDCEPFQPSDCFSGCLSCCVLNKGKTSTFTSVWVFVYVDRFTLPKFSENRKQVLLLDVSQLVTQSSDVDSFPVVFWGTSCHKILGRF
jgi:hypothetical protein